MMKKNLFLQPFFLLKIFVEPKVLLSTVMSIAFLLISTLFFGELLTQNLQQIKSYEKSKFKIIEKTSGVLNNQLFELSPYAHFYIDSKPKKILHFETYLKVDRFNYSENIISGTNINDLKNDEILISRNIAKKYDLRVGGFINGRNNLFCEKGISYKIKGIFDNFYGLREFPSDYNGVVIIGDFPSYTKNSLTYTFFNEDENHSYGTNPITVYQLIEKIQKKAIDNFIGLIIFSFIGNICWIEFIFFISFDFLKLVKGFGGKKYKLLLKNIHIAEIILFVLFCLIINLLKKSLFILFFQLMIYIILNLLCYVINLFILKRKEI